MPVKVIECTCAPRAAFHSSSKVIGENFAAEPAAYARSGVREIVNKSLDLLVGVKAPIVFASRGRIPCGVKSLSPRSGCLGGLHEAFQNVLATG